MNKNITINILIEMFYSLLHLPSKGRSFELQLLAQELLH
jgi:hypothetical protein